MKKSIVGVGAFQRNVGALCGLLFGGIAGRGMAGIEPGTWLAAADPLGFAALALLFLASARLHSLRLFQPVGLLAVAPLHSLSGAECPCGLVAAIGAAFLLFRMGHFKPGRAWKAVSLYAAAIAGDLGIHAAQARPLPSILLSLVYGVILSAVIAYMIRYGDGSALESMKPVLKLERLGLTERERFFVRLFLEGKTLKEISFFARCSDSTIRNSFRVIYRKLKVTRSSELAALGERYRMDYAGKAEGRTIRTAFRPRNREKPASSDSVFQAPIPPPPPKRSKSGEKP